ncbi:tRNA (guanine(46)-N(7))-methyltransferase TrmB [Galliscardovia ingluviei]
MSFVRRTSRLDKRLQHAWDAYADQYLLDIQGEHELSVATDVRIDKAWLRQQFGNDNPVIVEIGSGQGENVVAAAAANPYVNFIAVEVYQPGVAHTMLLAGKQGLNNVKVAQVNAPELFEHMADGIVSEVWTYFPDPWPKMRHHKRRLVQDSLAQQVHRVLAQTLAEHGERVDSVDAADAGVWRIATDIDDYALHVHEVMDVRQDFMNEGSVQVSLPTEHVGKGNAEDAAQLPHADFLESERFAGRVLTNFEKKGLQAGRTIHDFTYRAV